VVKLYFHLTGGVDSGLNVLDILNYWRQQRVAGTWAWWDECVDEAYALLPRPGFAPGFQFCATGRRRGVIGNLLASGCRVPAAARRLSGASATHCPE
jgi:hypothetical protein